MLCLGSLPYKHKIVVAGNHELSFDDQFLEQKSIIRVKFDPKAICDYLHSRNVTKMKDLLVNCTYLEDSETTVFGLRVYGSPWYVVILFVICSFVLLFIIGFMQMLLS